MAQNAIAEIKFQWGFREEMNLLALHLYKIEAVLRDAEEKTNDYVFDPLVVQFKEITFKIEDTIEEFMLAMELAESNKPTNVCGIDSCTTSILCFLKQRFLVFQFRQQLKSILKDLNVLKEVSNYQVASSHQIHHPVLMYEPFVVGIDERLVELEKLVKGSKEEMVVITVWGPAGLGKTTLINQLQKNIQFDSSIDCYACTYVGLTRNFEDILREIVKKFYHCVKDSVPVGIDRMDARGLQKVMFTYLEHKSYVLILDDVWDHHNVLLGIQSFLPVSNGHSCVIITTRHKTVASHYFWGRMHHYFRVECLNHELSWDLFCKVAFGDYNHKGCCPSYLIPVARKLVYRCQGFPFAIVAVGRLLSTKVDNLRRWNDVVMSPTLKLDDNLKKVLLLSYKHLPRHLKYCFLYCAMFPKGHRLTIKKLTRLCIAEDFVKETPGEALEDVARDYFLELINRSMLKAITHRISKETIACQMYNFMHDLVIPILANENFGVIFSEQTTLEQLEAKQRRLILCETSPSLQLDKGKCKLRSLISCNGDLFCSTLRRISPNIKLLRVLDLDGGSLESLPDELGNLIHLRYLSLKNTSIVDLPSSFAQLRLLQTLDIRGTKIKILPKWVMELQELRHLLVAKGVFHEVYVKLPRAAFKSKQLQTLSGVVVEANQARELAQMKKLRKLVVFANGEECCREVCASVRQLTKLRSLTLGIAYETQLEGSALSPPKYLEKLRLEAALKELPNFLGRNCFLLEIQLWFCLLKEDPFPVLGELPILASLSLTNAYLGEVLNCGVHSFTELKHLSICFADNLRVWNLSPGSMKRLETLTISHCPRLKNVPDILQHLVSLQEVYMYGMNGELLTKIAVDGPESRKVRHIRKIFWDGETLKHTK